MCVFHGQMRICRQAGSRRHSAGCRRQLSSPPVNDQMRRKWTTYSKLVETEHKYQWNHCQNAWSSMHRRALLYEGCHWSVSDCQSRCNFHQQTTLICLTTQQKRLLEGLIRASRPMCMAGNFLKTFTLEWIQWTTRWHYQVIRRDYHWRENWLTNE